MHKSSISSLVEWGEGNKKILYHKLFIIVRFTINVVNHPQNSLSNSLSNVALNTSHHHQIPITLIHLFLEYDPTIHAPRWSSRYKRKSINIRTPNLVHTFLKIGGFFKPSNSDIQFFIKAGLDNELEEFFSFSFS
jgi:hypothetical protein